MKFKTSALLLVLLLGFSACRKDRDGDTNNEEPLTGIAAFLNGEFEVTRVDYNGSFDPPIGPNIPLSGTGDSTQGYYLFDARAKNLDYDVFTRMEIDLLGQTFNIPVRIDGSGTVDYVSETRFTVDDPDIGLVTYDINNKTSNSLRATTRYETDTLAGELDMLLDVYLTKK